MDGAKRSHSLCCLDPVHEPTPPLLNRKLSCTFVHPPSEISCRIRKSEGSGRDTVSKKCTLKRVKESKRQENMSETTVLRYFVHNSGQSLRHYFSPTS